MANHKRKHKKWQKLCMCKVAIGKGIGNDPNRISFRDKTKLQKGISDWL